MSILIKVLLLTSVGFAGICGVLIAPVLQQPKVVAKRPSPEYVRRVAARDARLSKALAALSAGDEKRMPEVRSAIAELDKGSLYRPQFAKLLDQRGEHEAAFKLESERAHFLELSVPDDSEMAFYAALADETGRPAEASWARARMGIKGHFRVWEIGTVGALAQVKSRHGDGEMFEHQLGLFMQSGQGLYPSLGTELERLRVKMLNSSPQQIQELHDELAKGATATSIKP
ncbi:MAG: hypothetical protein P4L46_25445 [Fimbriimonas sp.]|nr:hypothetical protein [Fimbriimonas sp.]